MNKKSAKELVFWKSILESNKLDKIRKDDWNYFNKNFKGLEHESGKGLDLGCGLKSVLEYSDLDFIAYDPLNKFFEKLIPLSKKYVKTIPKIKFDWILCVNVVDHTPKPKYLFDYIKKSLKVGGRLYFNVNFDKILSKRHFKLWNIGVVDFYLKDFTKIECHIEKITNQPRLIQSKYWATYRKDLDD